MRISLRHVVLSVLFGVAATPAIGRAQSVTCTAVTAVPAVITVPGVYCLTGTLTTAQQTGAAIDIQASNVVLDLQEFRLAGGAAGLATEAIGVVTNDQRNVTIKNGTIRGFLYGVRVGHFTPPGVPNNGTGYVIETIRFDQNTYSAVVLAGAGSIVRDNQVLETGGTTRSGFFAPKAITVTGDGVRVLNNDIITVYSGAAGSVGILVNHGTNVFIVGNRVNGAVGGVSFASPSTGKYRDNLTVNVATPYTGGTDAGSNN